MGWKVLTFSTTMLPVQIISPLKTFSWWFQVLSRSGLECHELETLCIKDQALSNESQYYVLLLVTLIITWANSLLAIFYYLLFYGLLYRCREDGGMGFELPTYAEYWSFCQRHQVCCFRRKVIIFPICIMYFFFKKLYSLTC